MKVKVRSIIGLWMLCGTLVVQAQSRLLLSQYMYNGLALNPAYAGSQQQFSLAGLYRDQWQNVEGAPTYQLLSAHTPIAKNRLGLGLLFTRESVGVHQNHSIFSAYAYKIKLSQGYLSMGLFAGASIKDSDYTQLRRLDADDELLNQQTKTFMPNFGLGFYYYNSRMYAGISVPYILDQNILDNSAGIINDPRSYYATAGAVLGQNEAIKFNPSFLLKLRSNSPLGLDLNINMILQNVVYAGVSYRTSSGGLNNGIVLLTQLVLNTNLRVMYAYDFTTSALNEQARGSHEIMLNYRIVIRGLSSDPNCSSYF